MPRLVAFILLVLAAATLFGLAGQPDRAPRLLGPLGDRIVVGRRRSPVGVVALGGAPVELAMGGARSGGSNAPASPAPDVAAAETAPMGGGARLRAHRAARLALARAGWAADVAAPAESPAPGYFEAAGPAPVRGIGRFARPRYGPPRRI